MTGPEHYREAERRLLMAWEDDSPQERSTQLVAEAHVHATLALVAATVEMANSAAWAADVTTRALDDFTEAVQSPGSVL